MPDSAHETVSVAVGEGDGMEVGVDGEGEGEALGLRAALKDGVGDPVRYAAGVPVVDMDRSEGVLENDPVRVVVGSDVLLAVALAVEPRRRVSV